MFVSPARRPVETAPYANRDAVDAALSQTRHATIRDFLTYYAGIHPAAALPARSSFSPMALPRLLPHLVLAEVERQPDGRPARFRIKVAGEEVGMRCGCR